jgi:hypothetical protein
VTCPLDMHTMDFVSGIAAAPCGHRSNIIEGHRLVLQRTLTSDDIAFELFIIDLFRLNACCQQSLLMKKS